MLLVQDLTQSKEDYRNSLRNNNTPITYQPVVITVGDHGQDEKTIGVNQVIPARVDIVGLDSEIVKAGLLEAGDIVAAIPGDEDVPIHSQVIAKGETCRVVKISKGNSGVRKMLYLKKERPNV